MTSALIAKELFNAGGKRAEKKRREEVTVLMRINNAVEFFYLSKEDLVKNKRTSVLDSVKTQVKQMKYDAEKLEVLYRLLAQSMFGVNKECERVKELPPPSILHLSSFCKKNHLHEMALYYEICAACGEDIEMTGMVKMILSAVETTSEINKIVGEIVGAVPFIKELEDKLEEEEEEESDVSDDEESESSSSSSSSSSSHKKKKKKLVKKAKTRKAAKTAKKRMEASSDDDSSSSSSSSSSSESSASSVDRFDEKEEAELAEKHGAVKKSKTRIVYERSLSVFFPIVVRLMVKIALDKIFRLAVTQFMAQARKMEATMKKALGEKRKAFGKDVALTTSARASTTTASAVAATRFDDDDRDVMGDEERANGGAVSEDEQEHGENNNNDDDDDEVVVITKKAKIEPEIPIAETTLVVATTVAAAAAAAEEKKAVLDADAALVDILIAVTEAALVSVAEKATAEPPPLQEVVVDVMKE